MKQASHRARRVIASRRGLLLALGVLLGTCLLNPVPGGAGEGAVVSADQAFSRAEAGEVVLIDVRAPQEWRQTGIPRGARQVTIHDPNGLEGFLAAVTAEVGGDLETPIALICARGNRSTLAQQVLSQAGFSTVLNIREGMLGSASGPGWLARNLPVDDCTDC